jgi:hypothetical protein
MQCNVSLRLLLLAQPHMMKGCFPDELSMMSEEHTGRGTIPVPQRPVGVRWVVYCCGRILQILGLVLIWWVLLLFAGTAGMSVLLYWGAAAALVFYVGWACMMWARGK